MDQKQHSCGVLPWKLFTLVAKSDDFTLDLQKREKYVYYASLHLIFQLSSWISINISPWTAMSVKRIRNWKKNLFNQILFTLRNNHMFSGVVMHTQEVKCRKTWSIFNIRMNEKNGRQLPIFSVFDLRSRNLHSKNGFHASTPFFIHKGNQPIYGNNHCIFH